VIAFGEPISREQAPSVSHSMCLGRLVVAGKSMLELRHAKYATRSTDNYARKDGTLFRPTTSGPGESRQRAEAWTLDDRRH
jgi:hypothetical protein